MTFALLAVLAASPLTPPPMVDADTNSTTVQRLETRPARLKYKGTMVEGYHLVETPNWSVFGAGLGIFAGSYVPWSVIGTMLGSPENLIPVIGPILAFRPASGWFSELANGFSVLFIAVDAIAQLAGLTTAVVGLVAKRRWLERDQPAISFVPTAAGADFGASVIGRF